MAYDVYGVGNAIMDLQVQCDDAVLDSIGVEKGIMTLTEEAQQKHVLNGLSSHPVNQCSGGSAANTIVGLADFGGKAAYACKVGNDAFGTQYLDEMRRLGITVEVAPSEGGTGTCVVLITPDAQRTMLTHLGVSATLGPDDINTAEIAKAKYVYIEGYLFAGDSTRAAALKAIKLAKQQGVKVALTVSDPFLIDLFRDQFIELIEGPVDLLFCNEQEARALTGFDNPVDCAQAIHKHADNVALTLGKNGSILMHEGEVIAVESMPVTAVDTTGAGDMYAAGVLYGITNGLSWQQAGHLGSHAAAQIVSRLGARLPKSYSEQEIRTLLS
ncbi:MAG: adenosine kinase [Zetaproteobacteria bacterium CG06_land_8_20_14_3_00_59_53]|nr:MAG: adenosine kinase [Zetaproteobacteria bacterium CG2_30_59_37]PIO89986.1 MAG: adenosine kinase [Zetaproteobacteria bacterium CG23_combo_of_CG06-09_8_20_14_all_59_86]PIQ64093.1 MAG: adenosine kinase [Zetaproteobacteria bacterium CG11_big_fil_rev_8_21_14_0_20_59_439]PIU69917.1 MAG: adenosine kinase [Zetaproteobacteria bacterium CG06_land_8_20_14_3_00_59_53]PIU97591.1 MAG: adenosine kinase [Zetaproteobacteria bacterium CG03_land_8_20_14_0_80_59_51]PIY47092.1 MAG: adenosine kinase [Zetaprote